MFLSSFEIKVAHVLVERETKLLYNPFWHNMLKVKSRCIRAKYEICSNLEERPQSKIIDLVLEP